MPYQISRSIVALPEEVERVAHEQIDRAISVSASTQADTTFLFVGSHLWHRPPSHKATITRDATAWANGGVSIASESERYLGSCWHG